MSVKICTVGMGYIGFPTACAMASAGHSVIGVDVNQELVDMLSRGEVHIVNEDGLNDMALSVISSGALRFSTEPECADAFVICVPTPVSWRTEPSVASMEAAVAAVEDRLQYRSQPTVDLSYVISAVRSIAPYVLAGNLVILESTVPPGTTEAVLLRILEEYGLDRSQVHVAHAPERVLPGAIVKELRGNDRVIGGITEQATSLVKDLYSTFVDGEILTTDATTAEMAKLMENTYRDINIALANEFAMISDKLGIDVKDATNLANRHPRVNILSPGPGVGGHCIPVDPYFIIERVPEHTQLLQMARKVNRDMPRYVLHLVDEMAERYGISKVAILGAAYKPDVGDCRESPSLKIRDELCNLGYTVAVHDPYVEDLNCPLEEVCAGADLLLVGTDHTVYKELRPEALVPYVSKRLLLDTRLTMPTESWEQAGFIVRRLGDGRYRVNSLNSQC